MSCTKFFVLVACIIIATTATASAALTPADLYVYYPFEETTGTVYDDAGPLDNDATFYRPLRAADLPGLDASNVTTAGQLGTAIGLGTRNVTVGGSPVSHEVVGVLNSGTNLPVAGDTFAVSFWLKPTSTWSNGVYASYKMNNMEWTIGYSGGLLGWSTDGVGTAGNFWGTAINTLSPTAYHHFVMQFSGTSGITAVYVDKGATVDNATTTSYWGNRKNGLCVGGRNMDPRDFTAIDGVMDDFAIISGTVNSADVVDLYDNGAAGSGLAGRRLVHYAMNEATGSTLADSSGNGNNAALLGFAGVANPTMGLAPRDVSVASETGKFGQAVKFAAGWDESARIATPAALPNSGDAFTVSFWYKLDESHASAVPGTTDAGWDWAGVISSWSANGIGFSVGQYTDGTGSILVRTTDGTSVGNSKTYGFNVGSGSALNLPTDQYAHFAVTVDGARNITGVYVNGVLQASTISNGHGVTNAGTAVLGARLTGTGPSISSDCSGFLDDYAVFKGQLTSSQIGDLMHYGVAACIPEPSSIVLLLGAIVMLFAARRTRG